MPRKPEELPVRRSGYCAGCQQFVELVLVAPHRYRCDPCAVKEKANG